MKIITYEKWLSRLVTMAWIVLALPVMAAAADRYVSATGTNDVAGGFMDWIGAATNLQAAIDESEVGDTVWVENGFVTDTGGRIGYPSGTVLTNRVVIDKAITVRSVSGDTNNPPVIVGGRDVNSEPLPTADWQGSGIGQGPEAVRCLYLASDARLIGFALTNGATFNALSTKTAEKSGAGVYCASSSAVLSNCIVRANLANTTGGGNNSGTLYDCLIEGNSIEGSYGSGGGGSGGIYWRCVFSGNDAYRGGGVSRGTSYDCRFVDNEARDHGGALLNGTFYRCLMISNDGRGYGGGASGGTLYNCMIVSNTAGSGGGGGAYNATLVNCTLVYNEATASRGGAYKCTITNSISWYNNKPDDGNTSIAYSCGEGYTNDGGAFVGNIDVDPQLVDPTAGSYGLRGSSPCVDTGITFMWMMDSEDAGSLDYTSRQRIRGAQVDMGAFEHVPFGTRVYIR